MSSDLSHSASPLPNCQAMTLGTGCVAMIAISTSSFLFLLRIQAVYSHSKVVRYAFFVLWLVEVGLLILIPLSVSYSFDSSIEARDVLRLDLDFLRSIR